jgi:hypothetical protein
MSGVLLSAKRVVTLGVLIAHFFAATHTSARELDPESRLVIAPGFQTVKTQCTVCHSSKLIIQNRADRNGWLQMIRWMQRSQGLWPLGPNEAVILDYLEANYAPTSSGRRAPLPASQMPAG